MDGRTYGHTDVRTDGHFSPYIIRSTFGSRPNKRLANGQRQIIYYDCGAWAHIRGYNFVVVGDNPKELYEKDGAVCDRKRLNGKDHLVPIEQPDTASDRKVLRYNYKLKRCSTYTKRITLVSDKSVYLCEYLGCFLIM